MSQDLHQQLVLLHDRARLWVATGRSEQFAPTTGICSNLRLGAGDAALRDDLLARWPGSSGSWVFPVPHPIENPDLAYLSATPDQMWNPEFEYARNRWALLEWLIEQTSDVQPGDQS